MSHDAWAAFAALELARDCQETPANWFLLPKASAYQAYATRDTRSGWPHPDGAVEISELPAGASHIVAVEFKRTNEGIHGVLTGIGQVQAYLDKGFAASVLVLPASYDNLQCPGHYVASVLDRSARTAPIGVFTYDDPDLSSISPFAGRLTCHRSPRFDPHTAPRDHQQARAGGRQRTQWAHVREGSTVPDPLFKYLQTARDTAAAEPEPWIMPELREAVQRLAPGSDPALFLANTSPRGGRLLADRVWRRFWFAYVLTAPVQRIWDYAGGQMVHDRSATELRQWNGEPMVFFGDRADSIKARLVQEVSSSSISADGAWEKFATNIRNRAHQFREDVDSGAEAAGFIDADGTLTELGFRFVRACERSAGANNPAPLTILRWALLTNGGLLALLHYIHSISDSIFRKDPLRFVRGEATTRVRLESFEYREALLDELASNLRVAARSARRPGRQRPPLEGEIITLRKLGLVGSFRVGVGLEINWPAVHGALEAAER